MTSQWSIPLTRQQSSYFHTHCCIRECVCVWEFVHVCKYTRASLNLVNFSWFSQAFQEGTPIYKKWPYCLVKWLLNVFYMGHKVGSDSAFSISREPLKLWNYISDISPHALTKYIRMNAWPVYLGPPLSCFIFIYSWRLLRSIWFPGLWFKWVFKIFLDGNALEFQASGSFRAQGSDNLCDFPDMGRPSH